MNLILGRKIVLGAIFIALAIVGAFFLKSPIDNLPLFTVDNVLLVVGTVLGITIAAKTVQAKRLENKLIRPYVTILDRIWALLDPTTGAITAIISFLLATFLVYYRLVDFITWFGYHAILLAYFDGVNVAKK
jgi:hypothetical protein